MPKVYVCANWKCGRCKMSTVRQEVNVLDVASPRQRGQVWIHFLVIGFVQVAGEGENCHRTHCDEGKERQVNFVKIFLEIEKKDRKRYWTDFKEKTGVRWCKFR